MLSDHLGDVQECINKMCREIGEDPPDGNFLDGWGDELSRFPRGLWSPAHPEEGEEYGAG